DEVALEETATRDEFPLGQTAQQCDAPFNRDQRRQLAAGEQMGRKVHQLRVLTPRPRSNHDMPTRGEVLGGTGEDFRESGQQPADSDVGEVAPVEDCPVAVIRLDYR